MATIKKDLGKVTGATGPAGKDAKITSVTITSDSTHTEPPTAEVVMGGEPGAQTMTINFTGLQGKSGSDASVPIATTGEAGKVKPDGTTIDVDESGIISLKDSETYAKTSQLPSNATTAKAGLVKPDDDTIKVTDDGTISVNELSSYLKSATADTTYAKKSELPKVATSDTAGTVKPDGTSIKVTTDGTISVETIPVATSGKAGIVKPDGTSIKVTGDGTISVDTIAVATSEVAGTVKPDGDTISVDAEGGIKVAKVLASTISGEIPLANLPQGALERVVTVADESSRFELTNKTVQLGDIVQQTDTKVMYVVVDEDQLSSADGYIEFTAGTATKANEATHAETADKVGSGSVGSETLPVYIKDGVPTPVTKVASATAADSSTTAITATKLGSESVGSATQAIYLDAGVPKPVTKVASAAQADNATNATSADSATNATTAEKLGSVDVGSANKPIYLVEGVPTEIAKVAAATTADSATTATTATNLGTDDVGNASTPIYLAKGKPTAVTKVASATTADSATNATTAEKLGADDLGNATTPIYLKGGVPTACSAYPAAPDLAPYLKSVDFGSTLKTSIDALPEKEIAEGDYIIVQAQGGATSRAKLGVSSTDDFGLVTTDDIATSSTLGLVKPDGSTITVTAEGVISAKQPDLSGYATTASLGNYIKSADLDNLLKSHIETIRTALGLATTEHMGLVPQLPTE